MDNPVLLFDGYCNLCSHWVGFVLKHDKQKQFRFCALQSTVAQKLLKKFNLPDENKTVVLLADNKAYTKSTAALHILKTLGGVGALLYVFILLPRFIRDAVYDFVARHRYQWFGKKDRCYFPSPNEKFFFIDN